jgi:hypothetical protein
MATKAAKAKEVSDVTGAAMHGLIVGVDDVGDQLKNLRNLEDISNSISELASALHGLSDVRGLSVLAEHGTVEDREQVLQYLRRVYREELGG